MYIHRFAYLYTYTHTHTYIRIPTYIYVYIYVYVHQCTYTRGPHVEGDKGGTTHTTLTAPRALSCRPLILNARDCVILSSRVWHRSGANISSQWRRAYMPQYRCVIPILASHRNLPRRLVEPPRPRLHYSAEPIRNPRTNTLVALALKCSDPSEHAQAAA